MSTPDTLQHQCVLAPAEIQRRVRELGPWFHNMNLGGVWTAPDHFLGDYPNVKWKEIAPAIPKDLRGKTVLDLGCNAGFYSFEMKRRGAEKVVAVDCDERYLAQAQFAAEVLETEIEFRQLSVYDIAKLQEKFDLVIFMGLFYHLRHPLLALDLIREHVARDLLLFQSMQRGSKQVAPFEQDYDFFQTEMFDDPSFPRMHFIEHSYSNDHTNWWIPNRACTEAMLRSAGFKIIQQPEEEVYLCRTQPLSKSNAVYPAPSEENNL